MDNTVLVTKNFCIFACIEFNLLNQIIMKAKQYFFAVDLGATSGRTILGTLDGERIELEEVTRFPNNLIEQGGHFY